MTKTSIVYEDIDAKSSSFFHDAAVQRRHCRLAVDFNDVLYNSYVTLRWKKTIN